MFEETCWFCGRTEKQVIEDDVIGIVKERKEEKNPVFTHLSSVKWCRTPPVCCVCYELMREHLIESDVVFRDELRGIDLI